MLRSIYEMKIQDVIDDVKKGDTCVLMKPKGVKLLINGPPKFSIGDKTQKPLNILDLIMTDLYVQPYMHIHKIKSKLMPDEVYEIVHNYDQHKIYLTSMREHGIFVNDYRILNHRANLYGLSSPTIPNLDMESLISLITAPEINFTRLKLTKIANAVMFLNLKYQAILENPYTEPTSRAMESYVQMVRAIAIHRPKSLDNDIKNRFVELCEWSKRVKTSNKLDIQKMNLPAHMLMLQDFTTTFLPKELYKFLKEARINLAIFRTILMMLSGKGYKEGIHIDVDSSDAIKALSKDLSWTV